MYPLKFENIYFDKIWGGRDLELFRNNLPKGNIGESWDVSCHQNGVSVISNGQFKGMKLDELIKQKGDEVVGTKICKDNFPLLVKLINANDKLSVQVHPDDEYAERVEAQIGKTEAWYVVEAFEGANLIVGTKECTKEQFKEAIEKGTLDKYLNKIPVKKGDAFFIKSGLIHAIGQGVIIAEIQQSSDITYRVFDYNRGREIHVEKALEVVDFNLRGEKINNAEVKYKGYTKSKLCSCDKFTMEMISVSKAFQDNSDKERFFILTCVEGQGKIKYSTTQEVVNKGDSILIPAALGEYIIEGNLNIIKSYI